MVVLPWWVAVIAFIAGAVLGIMITVVLIEDEGEWRR